MPQNNPTTPEHTTCEGCRWWYGGLCSNYESCLDHERWEMSPAQLIHSTLKTAAERAVAWSHEKHPQGAENWPIDKISGYLDEGMRKAILAPLTKPDEIESATLDEVNHRRGFDK